MTQEKIDALGGTEELNKIAQALYPIVRINREQEGDLLMFAFTLRQLFKALGYHKLPEDKPELRQRIIEILVKPLKVPYQQDAAEMMVQGAINQAEEILSLIPELPEGKPPLLSELEVIRACKTGLPSNTPWEEIAQAQRDSDIKWYER